MVPLLWIWIILARFHAHGKQHSLIEAWKITVKNLETHSAYLKKIIRNSVRSGTFISIFMLSKRISTHCSSIFISSNLYIILYIIKFCSYKRLIQVYFCIMVSRLNRVTDRPKLSGLTSPRKSIVFKTLYLRCGTEGDLRTFYYFIALVPADHSTHSEKRKLEPWLYAYSQVRDTQ